MSERHFIYYPKCSTCRKAEKWLEEKKVGVNKRHIVEKNPTFEELTHWINLSRFPIKKFFNTSGLLYKSMNIKEKFGVLTEKELIELLASNGMLVKRPIIITEKGIALGFNPEEWLKLLEK
ncbi:MAG: arsenate reductase family protein [Alphaproteobacteria bacterium]|nr:arsenate reductase family protein [Alphaproteobacteria bacterium]